MRNGHLCATNTRPFIPNYIDKPYKYPGYQATLRGAQGEGYIYNKYYLHTKRQINILYAKIPTHIQVSIVARVYTANP